MPHPTLEILEPILINGNKMLNFNAADGVTDDVSAITFSPVGEVQIVRHEMYR